MNGSGIENATALAGSIHVPQTGSCGQKGSVKMHREYFLPIAVRQIMNTANDLDPRIAAQDIDAAKFLNGSCHGGVDSVFIGDV